MRIIKSKSASPFLPVERVPSMEGQEGIITKHITTQSTSDSSPSQTDDPITTKYQKHLAPESQEKPLSTIPPMQLQPPSAS